MRTTLALAILAALCFAALGTFSEAQDAGLPAEKETPQADNPEDDPLARDLKLLQGKWELFHGNEGKGPPTIRSVKEIIGNRETLRRYDIRDKLDEKLLREHSVDFMLSASESVRVFTFYGVGGNPKNGLSFVYKVDADNFYDIPGLLQGETYRNYQESPTIWHWKRVKEEK